MRIQIRKSPERFPYGWVVFVLYFGLLILSAALFWGTGGAGFCLFHRFTGFPCPGCGLSRAWISLAQGRILEALLINPLMLILSLLLTLHLLLPFLFRIRICYRTSALEQKLMGLFGLALLLLNWLYILSRA